MRARLESLLFVLVLLGCTKSNPQLVPIDGQVTMDGAPLADHVVTFTPVGDTKGSGALGSTDDTGRFSLTDARAARPVPTSGSTR